VGDQSSDKVLTVTYASVSPKGPYVLGCINHSRAELQSRDHNGVVKVATRYANLDV
jgi:hypothetical protein